MSVCLSVSVSIINVCMHVITHYRWNNTEYRSIDVSCQWYHNAMINHCLEHFVWSIPINNDILLKCKSKILPY